MLKMENAEEVMQILERFTRLKQKEIPKELDDYMHYVAKTGDTVFKWSSLKYLFREKLLNVIKNFHDTSPRVDDLPQYPNVDPFNYESMKSSLLERLELFNAAPFTVQRLCELLTEPRKQYSRIDKFMRALEKNILVSTIEPGRKRTESENGDSLDSVVNGDVSLDVNVDIDMENETIFNAETQNNATSSSTPSSQPSSLIHKSDDDILPNPKKAKLDIDENNDAETEAATKSIISNNNKTESTDSPSDDKVVVAAEEETADIDETKKTAEEKSTPIESTDEKTPSATASGEAVVVGVETKIDNKEPESEKMEEDDTAIASTTDDKVQVENEKKSEVVDSKATSIEADQTQEKSSDHTKATDKATADSTENTEKMDDEPEKKTKDCTEVVLEKQDTTEEIATEKANDNTDTDANKENNEINEKTETTLSTATTTTDSIPETTSDKQSESGKNEELKKSESIATKDTPEEVTTTTSAEEEPRAVVAEVSKVEIAPSAVSSNEDPVKLEETKQTDAVAVPSAPSDDQVQAPISENSTETVEKIDAADQPPPTAVTTAEIPPEKPLNDIPTGDIQSAETKQLESTKPIETPTAAKQPATESGKIPEPAATDESSLPSSTDQPMDENLESIVEAEPHVLPTIVVEAAPAVEEVVMGDGGNATVEMATDVIEPSKDEPAGMEVDDTSQEAMDH